MRSAPRPAGDLIREWRQRRRLSQLELANEAEISTRHLSFVETGRAQPSREMVLHLAEKLDVPLRERNAMLVAAGFAPVFSQRSLDDPEFAAIRRAIEIVVQGHEPYPALAIDRHWNLIAANAAVYALLSGVDPKLLTPPVNVLRLSVHPEGLASRVANLAEWRAHLFERLRRQIEATSDPILIELVAELRDYPLPAQRVTVETVPRRDFGGVVLPFDLVTDAGLLSFFTTTTIFGTPLDVTVSELAIESFYPADAQTAAAMQARMQR
jgi:transcriptional regulator with XRE-family HTH domain